MDDSLRFDDTLFAVLKDCKTLPTFFDAVFGFLYRRTDFYVITQEPNSPVGLPEGLAERLVKNKFYQWKLKHSDNQELTTIDDDVPEAVSETVVETSPVEDSISTVLNRTTLTTDHDPPEKFTSSESYNGAVYERYSWSQTINEVDVIVKLPENIVTKNLSVSILPQRISVRLKEKDPPVLLEGDLCQKCKHSDAIWSLDKTKLQIHLEKSIEMWWDCLLRSEAKLDIRKIDPSRPYEELSDEAQAKIQELTWNQERKRLGLPTSDQLKMQEKLKHAWNAEGSPFREPFDPDTVVFQ